MPCRRPRPPNPRPRKGRRYHAPTMKLSIVIPVFNESATFEEILSRVESCPVDFQKQIIVVDDASTDGSAATARSGRG